MKKMVYTLAVAMLILIAMVIVPATAESSSNEKISVIIGFKDKSDATLVKAHGGEIKYQYNTVSAIAASLPEQAISSLENNPNVAYIEEDTVVHITPILSTSWTEDLDPETPWGVDRIGAADVHSSFTGEGVKVAVIDTGIDYNHPDLEANYAGGYNVINPRKPPLDDYGHGTHVAGTIAAIDNDDGVVGVAPKADLYAVKVLNKLGWGYESDINAGIEWAIANHMDVISMSLGGGPYSQTQNDICQEAYNAGIVIVAAAGNDYYGSVSYPAAYPSVIAVSATNRTDGIAYFSNIGSEIDLAAPGLNIYSTTLGGGYGLLSGTSMATPHVTGVVALLLSADSTLEPADVYSKLTTTADDLDPEGEDDYFGSGLVNASAALSGYSQSVVPGLSCIVENINPIPDGSYVSATATVIVKDGNDLVSEGYLVTGQWTVVIDNKKVYIRDVSGTTNSNGEVTFSLEEFRFKETYNFDDLSTMATLPAQ